MSLHHGVNLHIWVELALALSLASLYIFLHSGVVHHHLFQEEVGTWECDVDDWVFLVERTREWWWRVARLPGSDTHGELKKDDGSGSTCQQKKISLVQPSRHELQLQFCFPRDRQRYSFDSPKVTAEILVITRSSWFNCTLRDDEAVYWISIGHYEAVAVSNWWYWVSKGHLCL